MCAAEGEVIGGEGDVLDLIGNASYQGAQCVVIPAERFDEAFFQLRTRVAGDIVQKFANYRMALVVLGTSPVTRRPVRRCGTSSVSATGCRPGSSPMSRNCGNA